MRRPVTMQAHHWEPFVRFLDEHPGFSPLLLGEEVLVCGFQVGGCIVGIHEMERLVAAPAALLLSTPNVGDGDRRRQ